MTAGRLMAVCEADPAVERAHLATLLPPGIRRPHPRLDRPRRH